MWIELNSICGRAEEGLIKWMDFLSELDLA